MARGQYELPLTRPRPTYGPPRPPNFTPYPTIPTRPEAQTTISSQSSSTAGQHFESDGSQNRQAVLVICTPGSEISRSQISNLKAKLQPEVTVQMADTRDVAMAAISHKPAAILVVDDILIEPYFQNVKLEVARYVQNGGRLITDSSQVSIDLCRTSHEDIAHVKDKQIDSKIDHITAISACNRSHLVR